jgi:signal transduction histidine kinase
MQQSSGTHDFEPAQESRSEASPGDESFEPSREGVSRQDMSRQGMEHVPIVVPTMYGETSLVNQEATSGFSSSSFSSATIEPQSTLRASSAKRTLKFLQRVRLRRRGADRLATLRRLPVFAALASLAVLVPFANHVASRFTKIEADKQYSWKNDALNTQTRNVMVMLAGGAEAKQGWIVHPEDRTWRALEKTDIEPPLFQLTEAAQTESRLENFTQRGRNLDSLTTPVDGKNWVVTVVDTGWYQYQIGQANNRFRKQGWIAAALASLLLGLLTRLLTRPMRRVLMERADFFADAAHEMRTPLAVIRASASHALTKARSSGEYVQSLAEISTAAERASAGVTDLLDLARFDAGQALPRLAPLRLDLLAEEIAATTRVEKCDVEAEVGPSALVQADLVLLRQAVDNIVRNAASRSSRVVLRCELVGRDAKLTVTDDGPGFAPEHLPYVFERYRRGDSRGSLGLGLPIAASIVAAHGGTIEVVSPVVDHPIGVNRGAEVTIRIPRTRQP